MSGCRCVLCVCGYVCVHACGSQLMNWFTNTMLSWLDKAITYSPKKTLRAQVISPCSEVCCTKRSMFFTQVKRQLVYPVRLLGIFSCPTGK